MASKLALHGGSPVIERPFKAYLSIGREEAEAVQAVIESGSLSQFYGSWGPEFFGGPRVQAFEAAWRERFGAEFAISVNSATSGLIAAVGALGVEPGDEVIVTPWTMSATATAAVVWNAVPVFVDIEPETFTLDPSLIEAKITPHTKAIIVADIFGHAAELDAIMEIARAHGLRVIEDAAQAPGAVYRGRSVGTVADIGVYSLNYHKHIHTGEGGMCVTDDPELCERMQLIRNHAEAVAARKDVQSLSNMVGFNFRMTEIEAAIGVEQLKKLDALIASRQTAAERLTAGLEGLRGLRTPIVRPECTHVYYVFPVVLRPSDTGVDRATLLRALGAEGVPNLLGGYTQVHLLPMYQRKIAFGSSGFPWSSNVYGGEASYAKGICPVAERLHDEEFMGLEFCASVYSDEEVDLLVAAFRKVWDHLDALA